MTAPLLFLLGGAPQAAAVDPYFYSVTSLLHGDGTNGAQNNTFLDSSTNNFTITRNGNTTQGSFSPFSQTGWGNYFSGSTTFVSAPANAAFSYGTGDFTYEAWIYPTADGNASTYRFIMGAGGSGQADQWNINNAGDQTLVYYDGAVAFTTTNKFTLNSWNHIAVSRNSGTLRVFINGVVGASGASTASITIGGSQTFYVGNRSGGADSPQQVFVGYMSNVRVLKGVGLYTANFTPPTTPLTAISGTSLLTCQANRFLDASSNNFTITRGGDTSVQPFSPFNPTTAYSTSTVGGSGYFDGSGDYLETTSSQIIPSGNFTIEAWAYITSSSSTQTIVAQGTGVGDGARTWMGIENSSGAKWAVQVGGTQAISSVTPVLNAWHYLAMVYNGSTIKMYLNGTEIASASSTTNASNTTLKIGTNWGSYITTGFISNIRISNTARTISAVPSSLLTTDANTVFLANFTNAGIFDNAAVADYETVGNAQVSTSVKKYGTGSMSFDGTGDYLPTASNQNFAFRTGDFTVEYWIYTNSSADDGIFQLSTTAGGFATSYTNGMMMAVVSGVLYYALGGSSASTGFTINNSTWYHIAMCRTSGVVKVFVNGTQVASAANTTDVTATNLVIGGYYSTSYTLVGYIDDFRISNGIGRYPYNFTPPTAEFPNIGGTVTLTADPYFDYTTLLLPGNGTNGAQNNTFLDSSTNNFTITRNGNTTQGTFSPFSQTGWGNYFDGTGDYLSIGTSTNLALGANDFTIECFLFMTAYNGNGSTIWDYRTSGGTPNTMSSFFVGSTGVPVFYVGNGSSLVAVITGSSSVLLNVWNHLALVRSGSTITLYLNGVSIGSATNTTDLGIQTFRINDPQGSFGATAYFSNFRIVKGTAVYTANFTPSTTPLTAITNTSLLTCQSNRFVDNSSNAFAITRNGDVSVQAFSPFNPTAAWSAATYGGSGYFDGSGDYLNGPSTGQFAPTGDFTISMWIYPTSFAASFYVLAGSWAGAGAANEWLIQYDNTGAIRFLTTTDSTFSAAGVIKLNQWQFLSISRTGSTLTGYVNGTSFRSYTLTGTVGSATKVVYIGIQSGTTWPYIGYMADFRMVAGSAESATPPTSPATAISGTNMLLNFTNAGIYDATSKNDLETVGNAQISTTQSKFGGSSIYLDGTGDYCLFPVSQNFAFGTGDFTLECWIRTNRTTQSLFGLETGTGSYGLVFSGGDLYWQNSTMVANLMNASATSILDNNWHHVALTRYNGTSRMFFDGVQVVSASDSTNYTATTKMNVGYQHTSANYYLGYINDLRITKGIARYTSNFTPPTTAFLTL